MLEKAVPGRLISGFIQYVIDRLSEMKKIFFVLPVFPSSRCSMLVPAWLGSPVVASVDGLFMSKHMIFNNQCRYRTRVSMNKIAQNLVAEDRLRYTMSRAYCRRSFLNALLRRHQPCRTPRSPFISVHECEELKQHKICQPYSSHHDTAFRSGCRPGLFFATPAGMAGTDSLAVERRRVDDDAME